MADEQTSDPVFEDPPVIETVLGVQFAPLNGLTSAHVGWFWKTHLDGEWQKVAETVALPDEFERFEATPPGRVQFRVEPIRFPGRVLISQVNDGRMIQIQPTRFHYNWNRVGGEYPRYRKVLEEFDRHFGSFCRFVAEAKLGEVVPNQWELTYIDSIPQGALWNTPADWHEVLPGLFSPPGPVGSSRLESVGGEWHFEIPPQRGRRRAWPCPGPPGARPGVSRGEGRRARRPPPGRRTPGDGHRPAPARRPRASRRSPTRFPGTAGG